MSPAAQAPRRLQFDLPGDMPALMGQVRSIEAFLREAGCSAASARQMAVVAEEVLANILRDAWPGREPGHCAVDVDAARRDGAIMVTLRTEDDGIAFDPTATASPDLDASLDEREVGGLGIFLVRSMTDTQHYRRVDGHNIFEVSKACPARD